MTVLAQGIGFFAMASNIISYQFKKPKSIMLFQLVGSALFAVNLIMLNATTGAILNIIGIFRALIYMNQDKIKLDKRLMLLVFTLVYLASYVCTFLVFNKAPSVQNLLVEILPLIGMSAITIGFSANNAKVIRFLGFINSPCWLTYNIIYFSLGGILCEIFGLISIISACIRHDTKHIKE